ncbi:spermidine/putrescine ABC transporter ATP-binding protein, partial [Escherichia coli]|nr:spermidine/putrescine ABC transporter ATP-binding protein [Escherichia coli]
VFQSYALWPHMSVASNVAYPLKMRKIGIDERARRVREALDMVGLSEYSSRMATDLSGGQQQRVALARALVATPQLLLFDEPLSNLDARLRQDMRSELREMHKRVGTTSIYVTHDQE